LTVASTLYELEELDRKIEGRDGALSSFEHQLNGPDALVDLKSEVELARQALRQLQSTEKDLELKDEEISQHLTEMEKKLYSGRVNNPKELAGINDDVAMLKRQRRDLDDQVLQLMDQVEEARGRLATLERDLAEKEAQEQARSDRLRRDIEAGREDAARLREERARFAEGVPAEAARRYASTRERKRPAVAVVERGVCSGCRVEVPDYLLKEARRQLAVCSSCNRILYVR
jgi:uncharacterized protein